MASKRRERKEREARYDAYINRPSVLARRRDKKELPKPPSRVKKWLSRIFWGAIGTTSVGILLAWLALIATGHTLLPTKGVSMNPYIYQGDLAVVKTVDPTTLKAGDDIAVAITETNQVKYNVPDTVLHRIVNIRESGNAGLIFTTQGTNAEKNPNPDPFETISANVIGDLQFVIPKGGMVFLLFEGNLGRYILGALTLVLVIYWLLGVYDRRTAANLAQRELMQELSRELRSRKRPHHRLGAKTPFP